MCVYLWTLSQFLTTSSHLDVSERRKKTIIPDDVEMLYVFFFQQHFLTWKQKQNKTKKFFFSVKVSENRNTSMCSVLKYNIHSFFPMSYILGKVVWAASMSTLRTDITQMQKGTCTYINTYRYSKIQNLKFTIKKTLRKDRVGQRCSSRPGFELRTFVLWGTSVNHSATCTPWFEVQHHLNAQ